MMETNRSTGGRPKDTFVDPHLIPVTDENGNVIARKCRYCDHRFSNKTSVTRIKAHLGGVPGQDVALCKNVPSFVKEGAKNAMPSSSTRSGRSKMVQAGASTPNLPHHLGHTHTQQPHSNQNSGFCHLDLQQPDLQARLQEYEDWLLSSPQDGESHLGHDITRDGLSQSAQHIAEDHEGLQPTPNSLNPISTKAQQTHECQNSESLSLAPLEPQYMLTELWREVREMPPCTPQPNESSPTQGTLASQHPRQQHLREYHDHLPDQEFLQDVAGMDSMHDATIPRNLLQGRACPNSLPDFAHQEDIPIADFDVHGGSEPQNMQLDVSVQQSNSVQLDPLGMGTDVLDHESPIEMSNLSRDFDQFLSTILNDPQLNMDKVALSTPQTNESCLTDGVLASPHPTQQHPREPYQDVLQDAPRMDSMHDTNIPQDILQREGAHPNSLPHSTHQGNIPIARFDNHEGSRSQHCMQENLQEDQRIDHDLIPPILPQLQHTHVVSQLESSYTPTCASDQTNEKKRKLLDRSPPIGKKLPPLVSKFQGPTFNKKVDEIVTSLEDDSVSRIGVYGMGGSGKTTIMKHIHNQLLEEYIIPFTHVIWVTVSQEHTIPKLQQHLANWLGLTLASNGDQVERAATLYEKMQNMRYALILDDVWGDINLEEVGIPEPSQQNMCKLILTTRLRDVCHEMDCDQAIFLDLLSEEEAGELFVKMCGGIPENLTIQSIMKEIVKECACLPLAIVVIARGMRGKSNDYQWRNALDSLRNRTYATIDVEKRVIRNLEFSFKILKKHPQQCLLNCALYPNDILRRDEKELIKMLVMEGTIGGMESLQSEYDYVQTILKKLEDACLLACASHGFEMHDMIRDMCLDIMGDRFLVKCHLESPPDLSKYKEVVEKISLIDSEFKEIPSNMMPYCPKLSTLLLMDNWCLARISDSSFMGLPRLKVLNLSHTLIEDLPKSITNLVSLNALVLRECYMLRSLPCLTPLKALEKLDLYSSGIQEAPEGLEELVNLTYVDLEGTAVKTHQSLILGNLVKLQHLKLPADAKIMMKDVKEFKNLEVFNAVFANWDEFCEYVRSMLNRGRGPSEYHIEAEFSCAGASCASVSFEIRRKKEEGRIKSRLLLLKKDDYTIEEDWLLHEVIGQIPLPEIVQDLGIFAAQADLSLQRQTKEIGEPKGLFDAKVVPRFQSLQTLQIHNCSRVKSIISSTDPMEKEQSNNPISFPNLCQLGLYDLPNLSSIYDGTLICPSIEYIWVDGCPKLKRIPLQVPMPVPDDSNNSAQLSPPLSSLKEIKGYSEWWEALEWDQPHAKTLLQPFFRPRLKPPPSVLNNKWSGFSSKKLFP